MFLWLQSKGKKNKQGGGDSEGTPTETGSVTSNNKVQPVHNQNPATNPSSNNGNDASKSGNNQQQPSQHNGASSKQPQPPNQASSVPPQTTIEENKLEKTSLKSQKTKKSDTVNPRGIKEYL